MVFKNRNATPAEGEVLPPEATKTETKPPIAQGIEDAGLAPGTGIALKGASTLPAEFLDEIETGATGLENVTANDLIIPRISIINALSPQYNRKKPEYIEGSELGDFCDTAIGDIYKTFDVIPVYYANVLLEWAPRHTGKGLVANHGMNRDILKKCRQDDKRRWFHDPKAKRPEEIELNPEVTNMIAETATFYCINLTAGGRRVFIPLSSTARKAANRWLTLITNERVIGREGKEFQPPIFYRSWHVKKTEESNSQGDWFGWKFEPGDTIFAVDPSKNLLQSAKDFMEQARSGLVSGDLSSYADDGTTAGGEQAQAEGETGSNDQRSM